MTPQVWNKRDPRVPVGAIYVGRPTIYGNPYSHIPTSTPTIRVATREEAVTCFEAWVLLPAQRPLLAQAIRELRGKHLVCWCAPSRCHADVWLRLVN